MPGISSGGGADAFALRKLTTEARKDSLAGVPHLSPSPSGSAAATRDWVQTLPVVASQTSGDAYQIDSATAMRASLVDPGSWTYIHFAANVKAAKRSSLHDVAWRTAKSTSARSADFTRSLRDALVAETSSWINIPDDLGHLFFG